MAPASISSILRNLSAIQRSSCANARWRAARSGTRRPLAEFGQFKGHAAGHSLFGGTFAHLSMSSLIDETYCKSSNFASDNSYESLARQKSENMSALEPTCGPAGGPPCEHKYSAREKPRQPINVGGDLRREVFVRVNATRFRVVDVLYTSESQRDMQVEGRLADA
jgi:hypothetical protein